MNSSVAPAPRTMPARHPRWRTLCLILAISTLSAIGIGVDLDHRLKIIYAESGRINRECSDRIGNYSELTQLAAAVNAPGHDVFDTHDGAAESAKLDEAIARVNAKIRELSDNTNSHLPA